MTHEIKLKNSCTRHTNTNRQKDWEPMNTYGFCRACSSRIPYQEMDSLQVESNQLRLGRSTISICMIQHSNCMHYWIFYHWKSTAAWECTPNLLLQLSKNNSRWIFYFCWPDLQLEHDIRTCNAVISSCEKAAKWCLRRHQLIAASFLYTPFALEKWHRETNICINWSTYEVLEDTSMMYCMPRSVFLFFNPAGSSTKGRSFAAFGRCNYTKSLISTNRHWLAAEQLSNDIKIYALNWRGHTRHRHTPICPWLKLTIYMCIFDHICSIHIHSSLIWWLSSS